MRKPRRLGLDRTVLKVVLTFGFVCLSSNLARVDQSHKMAPRAGIEQIKSWYMRRVYGRGLASWIFYNEIATPKNHKRASKANAKLINVITRF